MIPSVAHFVWLGKEYPYTNVLALRSCLDNGGFEKVILHCSDDLSGSRWWKELGALSGIEILRFDPETLLPGFREGGRSLLDLYNELSCASARSNILRTVLLIREGGVYLDFDTVTVAPFDSLLRAGGLFLGRERIVYPGAVRRSHNPLRKSAALLRKLYRNRCRIRPDGWQRFRRYEHHYPLAVNCAILGAEQGHPFLHYIVELMLAMPESVRMRRHALGPHLFQDAVDHYPDDSVRILDPGVFYPVPPEISEHWFRNDTTAGYENLIFPGTLAVHWYASVRTKDIVPRIDPEFIRKNADTIPYCGLVRTFTGRDD